MKMATDNDVDSDHHFRLNQDDKDKAQNAAEHAVGTEVIGNAEDAARGAEAELPSGMGMRPDIRPVNPSVTQAPAVYGSTPTIPMTEQVSVLNGRFGDVLVTRKQFVKGGAQNNGNMSHSLLTPYECLHVALGHASHKSMMNMARYETCIGLGFTFEEVKKMIPTACVACWIGKARKLPAPSSFYAPPQKPFLKLWYDLK
jgi:hypothetical protein